MAEIVSNLWRNLVEMVFPAFCLGCGGEREFLCGDCVTSIEIQKDQVCPVCLCKGKTSSGFTCLGCRNEDFFLDGLMTAVSFQQQHLLQKSIYAFKYNFIEELSIPLGDILFHTFLVANFPLTPNNIFVCPVPLHRKRFQFRGFNQAELLAQRLIQLYAKSFQTSLPYLQFLERTHFSKPQMELQRAERILNMVGAFTLRDGVAQVLKNATVILVDDVATTLSTLNGCAKVLKNSGAGKVFGLVLARGLGEELRVKNTSGVFKKTL